MVAGSQADTGMRVETENIIEPYEHQRGAVIPALQKVQERFGYLPPEAMTVIAKKLRVSESEVYGVASFYSQFRFLPQGRHQVKVCTGTACHVRGGGSILRELENKYQVCCGDTTPDNFLTLEKIACFGSCSLGPVMLLDGEIHGRLTPSKVNEVLDVLDAAAESERFLAQLAEDPAKALSGYDLTQEQRAALASGDIQWIEERFGKLDDKLATWLRLRLQQEQW